MLRYKRKQRNEATALFVKVIEQEKEWAKFLFKDGSMIGLNEQILCDYIEWIGCKRMRAIGYTLPILCTKMKSITLDREMDWWW